MNPPDFTEKTATQKPSKRRIFNNSRYFGFAAYVRTGTGTWRFVFNWRRIFACVAGLAVLGYLGIAAARYFNDKYGKGLEETEFTTMLAYPLSRATRIEHRKQIGDMYIERAKTAKTPNDVISNVITGLSYSPQNPDGRIYYSYLMFHQRLAKEAVRLLAEGLESALEHKEYVVYFVRRGLDATEDAALVAAADEMLPEMDARIAEIDGNLDVLLNARERRLAFYTALAADESVTPEARSRAERRRVAEAEKIAEIKKHGISVPAAEQLSDDEKKARAERRAVLESNRLVLAVAAVQAMILRGRFDDAIAKTEEYGIANTLTGQVLRAQVLWETGSREESLKLLDAIVAGSRGNAQVTLLRAHYQELAGNIPQARSGLLGAAISSGNPEAFVRLIMLYDPKSDAATRERFIADYLNRYRENPDALFLLAQAAANKDDFALAERLYKVAAEGKFANITRFEMVYIEMLVAVGRPKDALEMLRKLSEDGTDWAERNAPQISCIRTLAHYKNGNAQLGKLELESLVKNRGVTVPQFILVGRRLTAMGFFEEGRSAYEAAYLAENYNLKALGALVDYACEKKDAETLLRYLPELLAARRPSRAMLERIRRFLGSDRLMFVSERDVYLRRISEILDTTGGTHTGARTEDAGTMIVF